MTGERVQRRLAAILAADVVGYSRLMGEDEEGTHARLKTLHNELLDPKVAEYGGRIVKTTGDGILIEFPSAVDAVEHAVDVQRSLARRNAEIPEDRRILLRIGINLGDVIVDGDDLYGDGVNIAARLEGFAGPGNILLSDMVHSGVRNKLDVRFIDLGDQSFKNIAEPVHVYSVAMDNPAIGTHDTSDADAMLRRPAVAVLPIQNMSGDPEQEYFADGLTEDIITALSLWRSFPVIARNSTFAYKGASPDIRTVGEELRARYIVEGSVRKAGERVRVTAQLINSETGHHVWAERYDRQLVDIFDLQDEITRRIVVTLVPELERAEREKAASKPPENLDAWDCYLHGIAFQNELSTAAVPRAREMFQRAIALDPGYAKAHARLALTYHRELWFNLADDMEDAAARMMEAARTAVRLDDGDSFSHWIIALAYCWPPRNHDLAVREAQRALKLNPADVDANFTAGTTLCFAGRPEEAIPHIENAIRLSPNDPRLPMFHHGLALALFDARRYEDARRWAMMGLNEDTGRITTSMRTSNNLIYLASLGQLGRLDEARAFLGRTDPEQLRIAEMGQMTVQRIDANSREHFLDCLRKTGWRG